VKEKESRMTPRFLARAIESMEFPLTEMGIIVSKVGIGRKLRVGFKISISTSCPNGSAE
jgi:hypothetical protein